MRASYVGGAPTAEGPALKTTYDAANRAIEIKFAQPLEPFRTVKIEILEGPVPKTGAVSKLRSVYVRDPDLNLVEISVPA